MYKVYAAKARFGIRKSGSKKWKGEVTHKHVICNRGGKPRKIVETNTLNEDVDQHAQEDDNVDGKKKGNADLQLHLLIAMQGLV